MNLENGVLDLSVELFSVKRNLLMVVLSSRAYRCTSQSLPDYFRIHSGLVVVQLYHLILKGV